MRWITEWGCNATARAPDRAQALKFGVPSADAELIARFPPAPPRPSPENPPNVNALRDQLESGLRTAVGELLPSLTVATAVPRVAETPLCQYPEAAVVADDMQASVVAPLKVGRSAGQVQAGGTASAILSLDPEAALTWLRWRGVSTDGGPDEVLARFREEGSLLLLTLLGGAILPERASVREEGLVATVLGTHAPGSTRVASASLHVVGEDGDVPLILTLLSDPKAPTTDWA